MQGFKELFEAYGADYQITMNRFMGNEAMYMRLLDLLFRDTGLDALDAALKADDLSGAFEAAHALKGVVGNMGLTPLYNAISAIVEPLRAGERHADYLSLYQTIQIEFQKADKLREGLKGGAGR